MIGGFLIFIFPFIFHSLQVVSAIPLHLDGKSAPGQVPTGSVCYERNGVSDGGCMWEGFVPHSLLFSVKACFQ